jgi:large subunit ribosomal protein L15
MKLHDLQPAEGSRRPRVRVGRGVAAGKGKTAGKGTKGQKARAGGSIPAWFEGGQTPLHQRIPKLRGFKNRFRIEYEVVNIGRISAYAEADRLLSPDADGARAGKPAPYTVNQEILHAVGLVSTLKKPLKILGQGDVSVPLFVVADAFSRSAVAKIEAAGGSVQALFIPTGPLAALGVDADVDADVAVDVAVVEEEMPASRPAKKAKAVEVGAEQSDKPATAKAVEVGAEQSDKPARAKPARKSKASADEPRPAPEPEPDAPAEEPEPVPSEAPVADADA